MNKRALLLEEDKRWLEAVAFLTREQWWAQRRYVRFGLSLLTIGGATKGAEGLPLCGGLERCDGQIRSCFMRE